MAKRVVNFVINSEADKDIIRWLEHQDNKSAAIREAIRGHIGGGGVTIGDVYQAVKDLERKVQAGAVVALAGADDDDVEEDAEAAAALDALANL